MKANYFETILGFLTILISFIFLIKLISVNSNDSSEKYYDLNAKFLKVGGLIVGNDVSMMVEKNVLVTRDKREDDI